jgi:hypothetical protein
VATKENQTSFPTAAHSIALSKPLGVALALEYAASAEQKPLTVPIFNAPEQSSFFGAWAFNKFIEITIKKNTNKDFIKGGFIVKKLGSKSYYFDNNA